MERLLRRYGDRVHDLIALIEGRPGLAAPLQGGEGHLAAEVVYACHPRGGAPARGRARAPHPAGHHQRRSWRGGRGVAAALMAGELGWDAARVEHEVQSWHRRVAAERAGEAEPDDERALAAYRAALAAKPSPLRGQRLTGIVLGLDQGTSSTRCLALDHELTQRGAAVGGGQHVLSQAPGWWSRTLTSCWRRPRRR